MFDSFRRHNRIYIDCSSLNIYGFETTVAQLTFFRWAIENKIVEYAYKHRDIIKEDMDNNLKKRTKNVLKKDISKKKPLSVHVRQISINF